MAIGDSYATLPELKAFLRLEDAIDDAELADCLTTVSRGIEHYCRRQFNRQETASARVFEVKRLFRLDVADFYTAADLAVATAPDGGSTFPAIVDPATYRADPQGGVVDGEEGWPFYRLTFTQRVAPARVYLHRGQVRLVQVTARWGWASVPAPVHRACLILASELFKLRDAPFGIAGFGEYGAIRVKQNPMASALLHPYRRNPVLVG
jgi:hypothetical protein